MQTSVAFCRRFLSTLFVDGSILSSGYGKTICLDFQGWERIRSAWSSSPVVSAGLCSCKTQRSAHEGYGFNREEREEREERRLPPQIENADEDAATNQGERRQ